MKMLRTSVQFVFYEIESWVDADENGVRKMLIVIIRKLKRWASIKSHHLTNWSLLITIIIVVTAERWHPILQQDVLKYTHRGIQRMHASTSSRWFCWLLWLCWLIEVYIYTLFTVCAWLISIHFMYAVRRTLAAVESVSNTHEHVLCDFYLTCLISFGSAIIIEIINQPYLNFAFAASNQFQCNKLRCELNKSANFRWHRISWLV